VLARLATLGAAIGAGGAVASPPSTASAPHSLFALAAAGTLTFDAEVPVTYPATRLSFGPPSFRGRDTWKGTLVVPGLEFDLSPPTLSGAANKVVRAPRKAKAARVSFTVSARDDVDCSVPVTCKPRSGSRFKVGKTRVTCSATDTSGNAASATFTVTVKPRR
jgi:hypothetical protein